MRAQALFLTTLVWLARCQRAKANSKAYYVLAIALSCIVSASSASRKSVINYVAYPLNLCERKDSMATALRMLLKYNSIDN